MVFAVVTSPTAHARNGSINAGLTSMPSETALKSAALLLVASVNGLHGASRWHGAVFHVDVAPANCQCRAAGTHHAHNDAVGFPVIPRIGGDIGGDGYMSRWR